LETVGTKLEIDAETNNFAFGGFTTGTTNALSGLVEVPLPSLPSQLNAFTSAPGAANPDTLYVLCS
jgi:outer membrane lipase/esterase